MHALHREELAEAQAVRDKEAADFAASEEEFIADVDTLDRAIATLEKDMAKNPGASAQIDTTNAEELAHAFGAAGFQGSDKNRLLALIQLHQGSGEDGALLGGHTAAVYKSIVQLWVFLLT